MSRTIFATITSDQQAVEVFHGIAFTTYSVLVTSEEEAAWSFTPIGSRAPFEVAHSAGALENYSETDRTRYGIQKVSLPNPPSGKMLASYALEVSEGAITATPTWGDIPPAPVPRAVSRMQAKLALDAAGLLDDVEAAVASAPRATQIYWAEVSELHRDHPILNDMTDAIGWTPGQVDDLFIAAAAIT